MRYRTWLLCLLVLTGGVVLYLAESERFERSEALSGYERQLLRLETLARQQALPNFKAIEDAQARKLLFFDYLAPLVQTANNVLAFQARKLSQIGATFPAVDADATQTTVLEPDALVYVNLLAERYLRDAGSPMFNPVELAQLHERLKALEQRLLPVPASLPLAQAAIESAWGTSRFARMGNNLFGQWCFQQGCGMVPRARPADGAHEVASFASVYDSVVAYLLNINGHPAYTDLRALRVAAIEAGQAPDGALLAEGLVSYSQRGQVYVDEIRTLIRNNKLSRYVHSQERGARQVRTLIRELQANLKEAEGIQGE
ncbi:glucosaminidase domain-containing protein [Allohahella marinimesophila]|uniref:Mannosyl-glycoprotein endo-beta-N-acetylglucosamidase-like domain-containing protein n=1 Tax=Allohahella marinimesophila TaxID=1054972 RepID=A0ABP7PYB2_9GAMM